MKASAFCTGPTENIFRDATLITSMPFSIDTDSFPAVLSDTATHTLCPFSTSAVSRSEYIFDAPLLG